MRDLNLDNINEISNTKENIKEIQQSFLESNLGKCINSAIDIGLKAALPDFIEDQIIDIKNTILENGFSEGLKLIVE